MALTRLFKETVQARARHDRAFRDALLTEGVEALLSGEVDTGKAILRDYINATVGFGRLAEVTGTESKSLMRMLGPKEPQPPRTCSQSLAICSARPASGCKVAPMGDRPALRPLPAD